MSELRPVTPLLDPFILGQSISEHHGVRCYPAIHKETEDKYIVKVISIPASSVQLDAMLLSGAFANRDSALRYFRDVADDTVEEAKLLQKLSRLEGFRGYEAWQIEPMEDGSGYEVYLLSRYESTLENHLRKSCLTHLAAVNLGLDLCAALSVCRRNGSIYVDLKPENIFLSETKGYLIGDLGFVGLRSLKYASLPDKYRSAYTAPEITDAYSSLNSTIDIYAAGMVLYQVYNGGLLPNPDEANVPPAYADYEMAEIIMKALSAEPNERWQEPHEMGQALASYMQRNVVNDDPIIPVVIHEPSEPIVETEPDDAAPETIVDEENIETPADEIPDENNAEEVDEPESSDVEPEDAEPASECSPETEIPVEQSAEPEPIEVDPEEKTAAVEDSEAAPEICEPLIPAEVVETSAEEAPQEEEDEQFVIEGFLFDDPEDSDDLSDLEDAPISDEVSAMLAQADALIAHKTPDPVVAPEPIEIPMPEPIVPEPEPEPKCEPQPAEEPTEDSEPAPACVSAPEETVADPENEDESSLPPATKPKKRIGCLIGVLVLVLLLLLAGLGARYYYENHYLQNITSVIVDGDEDWLIVNLSTDIDNSLLTVECIDTYGNKLTQRVINNQAIFTSLPSGTNYRINVIIDGRHELTGTTTATYTTPMQTSIVGFTATAGDADGCVILNFTVQGPDSNGWYIKYSAEGVAEQTAECSAHMAILYGLEVGKNYTFHLVPKDELYVVSGDTLEFVAPAIIYPQNLAIHGFENGALVATWEVPEGMTVNSWTVRCYNSTGYDATFTVADPSIRIEGLDISQSYTLDVKAEGMTVSKWVSISAGSITFKDILLDNSDPSKLVISWAYEGTVPEGGWQLAYSVDGCEQIIVPCEKNTYTIEKLIPGGHYRIGLLIPPGTTVYGGTAECDVADVGDFSGYDVSISDMIVQMCKSPAFDGWDHSDVAANAYTTDFAVGDKAAFVLRLTAEYVTSPDIIEVTYIIRDASGNLIRTDTYSQTWTNLWYRGYCELDLPVLPAGTGSYTVEILFNNTYITADPISFTVS